MPTLTDSALTAAMYLQKDMFADSKRNAEYIAETNTAKVLIENTTAKIADVIGNPDKKVKVKIYFNKFCDDTVGTTEPNFCTISGPQADSGGEEYEIDTHVTGKFTLDEALYEDNNLNISEVFADNMLKVKKNCDEKISKVLIAKLGAFASPNLYQVSPGCPGVVGPPADWTTTFLNPSYWTPEIMYYFLNVKRMNKFASPFLLDGKNLGFKAWEAAMKAADANGAGASKMMQTLKYYEDLPNIEEVSPGKTYMVDKGTVAFASRSRWVKNTAANPILEPEISRKKYSEKSENLPGVNYDIYITTTCSGPYKKHNVLVHGMYGLYNGATGCGDATGVLEFECGACPTV